MWKLIDIAGFAYLTHTSVIIYKYQCTKTNNIIYIIEEEEEEYEDDCISHLYSINNDDFKIDILIETLKERCCYLTFTDNTYELRGCKYYEIMKENQQRKQGNNFLLKKFEEFHHLNKMDHEINDINIKNYDEIFSWYNTTTNGFPII